MAKYSEQDLKHASEFREEIHREALAVVRKTRPNVTEVVDRHPAEDYFQEHWDYPGAWYTIVAIPYGYGSRKALVDRIVRDTLSEKAPEKEEAYTPGSSAAAKTEPGRRKLKDQLDAKPDGYEELFVSERKNGLFRAVGTDLEGRKILEQYEEYSAGGGVCSAGCYFVLSDLEFRRFARLALINGYLNEDEYSRLTAEPKTPKRDDDPFYSLIAEYSDPVVDFFIVKDVRYCGYGSHRMALKAAFLELGGEWTGDPDKAVGKKTAAEEIFSSEYQRGRLNYRKAFLYPPHQTRCTGKDFARVNAALFPNGTDELEVFEWTTDWSDYFDDGHEWWGTLCLTVYDKSLDRFAVIMASATD